MENKNEKLLENLEVIEAKELEVGNAFHAFRFSSAPEAKEEEK
ncbi:hypothetical protein [Bacillus clarus]|uniref:Uncharacterized protein n=1 Tax=Bacillus clarus TaxID=2338372 RepID=A0A090YQL5_9BACI|nr:hypothetical protein [Bacillus clarus]KFN01084.1 hypothetical protein DJ93_256 [Bacillus clarus]